jgi:hypothetical protein
MYQTNTTFNTNELRLPLSSIVSITNTRHTFPLAYYYIISKLAKSFDFIARELTKYVFYNCPKVEVIIANFTRGLGAAIAAKARLDTRTRSVGYQGYQRCLLTMPLKEQGSSSSFASGILLKLLKRG